MYQKKLEDAIDTLQQIKVPQTSENHLENEGVYKRVYSILDEHVKGELADEQRLGRLVMALRDYKKHLEFAKMVLDKDFSSEKGHDDRLPRRKPHFERDMLDTERQIRMALKEWDKIRSIITELLDEGSLR